MTETSDSSLDAILDGSKPSAKAEAVAPEPVETDAEPSETGVKPDAGSPPVSAESDDNSPLVPRKALIEERRKRQDYEKKMAEFEAKLAELSKPQPPPQQQRQPQPPPDPWTDPQGAIEYERQQRAMELYETRVILSEEMMSQKPDYTEAKRVFIEAANADPSLAQKLVRHPMPAKFVYEEGKRLAALREIGPDPAAYRENLRQQLMEELRAEMGVQSSPVSQAPKAPAPKSLAGQTSAVPRDQAGRYAPRNGPTPLEDIIG